MIDIIISDFNDKIKVCVSPEEVRLLVKKTAQEIDKLYIIKDKRDERIKKLLQS